MFHYGERGFYPLIIILIILTLCGLFMFILECIIYHKSRINLIEVEQNPFDIDINVFSSFNFSYSTNNTYYPKIDNLGNTGKLLYNCYNGICTQFVKKECPERQCDDSGCKIVYIDCSYEIETIYSKCSNECRAQPNSTTCNSCDRYDFSSNKGKCNIKNNDEYSESKSCHADNLILNWRGKRYSSYYLNKTYSYLNNTILFNETCPDNTIMCGIIDSFNNKLCIPYGNDCPLNNIKVIPGIDVDPYENYVIIGNNTIIFSNKNETGKIIEGIYADSDLMIKYNDCEIIDTNKISEFINDNEKLYRDSLNNYDPYKDVNVDHRGKSYLRWCTKNNGKGINLTEIRENKKRLEYNISVNLKTIPQTKTYFKNSFVSSLFAFIYLFFVMGFYFINIVSEIMENPYCIICIACFISNIELLNGIYFTLLMIPYIILNAISQYLKVTLIKDNLLTASKFANPESNIMKTLITLNNFYFWGIISFYIILLIIIIYGGIITIVNIAKNDYDYIEIPKNKKINIELKKDEI